MNINGYLSTYPLMNINDLHIHLSTYEYQWFTYSPIYLWILWITYPPIHLWILMIYLSTYPLMNINDLPIHLSTYEY